MLTVKATVILSSTGMILGLVGAVLVASNSGLGFLGYAIFTGSSLLWCTYAFITKQINLLITNIGFLSINVYGLYNFLEK